MSDYQYTSEMIEDLLRLKRRSIELYEKATLAFHQQGAEFRVQSVLDAISRLEREARSFTNSVRRREETLADEREREVV